MDTKANKKNISILYFFGCLRYGYEGQQKRYKYLIPFFGGLRYGYEGLQKRYKYLIPFSEAFGMDTKAYKKV